MSERRGTKGLELWCRRMTEGYPGVKVENMTTSWRDGLAFCAIIHHFRPDLIDFSKLNKDNIYYNNELAFRTAERHLGIPALLEPEDMVECSVPDRLSILTYLSQFYQAFVASQGSPSRLVPKRPATSTERPIVSPSSTGPSSKVPKTKFGVVRRDPCAKCGLPVFIAERLSVGKLLFHRTCFRCARCNSQLTLANYYETESDQFCCETCPDEEVEEPKKTDPEVVDQKPDVLTRSLSDEEKSANLKKQDEHDNGTRFENTSECNSDSGSQHSLQFSKAMSFFMNSQIETEKDENMEEEKFPDLPKSQPPDISTTFDIGTSHKISENMSNFPSEQTLINSAPQLESYDSGFPHASLDLTVNNSRSIVYNEDKKDQQKAAEIQLDTDKVTITKENEPNTSLVKARMQMFESNTSLAGSYSTDKLNKLSVNSPEKIVTDGFDKDKLTESQSDTKLQMTSTIIEKTQKDASPLELRESINLGSDNEDSGSLALEDNEKSHSTIYSDDLSLNKVSNIDDNNSINNADYLNVKDVINTEDSSVSVDISTDLKGPNDSSVITLSSNDDSVIVISDSNDNSSIRKEPEDYPKDLNPFGSDDENDALNPFNSDNDDEDDDGNEFDHKNDIKEDRSPPKPAARKKIIPTEVFNKQRISNVPEQLSGIYVKRISENPFEEDENDNEIKEENEEKTSNTLRTGHSTSNDDTAPKINLNPFMSDDEESEDDTEVQKPVPKPRNVKTSSTNLRPTHSSLDVNGESLDPYGSMSSIASSFVTTRKKKIAPPPPSSFNDSDHSSITSSPTPSAPHSPRMTPRSRKTKKAPLPPMASSSTPFNHGKVAEYFESGVSPLSERDYHLPPPEIRVGDYETEKTNKDKENRNRQSQIYDTSSNTPTITDKSTHGKWKRRKGPAPARPIPQRRQIKPLPTAEIKRELDFIEIQQQGLERQGVRLEQIIREKCEGPNSDPEGNMSPEVEELILQLFELVNEKNELFRKQAELMYLRRQQRLEEEYADLEYQIRCLMLKPEMNQTDSDKAKKEEELINRLVEVVERRNEIVECLEMDRIREAEEDTSITNQMTLYTSKVKDEIVPLTVEENKKEWKQKIKKKLKLSKSPKVDADKDIDESEVSSNSLPLSNCKKEKKKKKFNLF